MVMRRRLLKTEESPGGRLPSEYQEVEYITSQSKSYIALGAKSYTSPGFKCDLYMTKRNNSYGPHIISSSPDDYFWFVPRSTGGTKVSLRGSTSTYTPAMPLGKRAVTICNVNNDGDYSMTWDGGSESGTVSVGSSASATAMHLFAYSGQLSSNYYYFIGRCYSIQIYDSGVLVEDYVPCYRKSDNKAGLYDIVNDAFYTSAGSANFSAGPDV